MDICPSKHHEEAAGGAATAEAPAVRPGSGERSRPAAPAFWRSLEELAGSREFEDFLHREFPRGASEWKDPVSRRSFLKLMGASLALAGAAGLGGCTRQPKEEIIPYVTPPEYLVPGKPLFFATAMPFGGYGMGLLAEQHMGRPTKVEGNPDHPASLGATDHFAQASVLTLWDPDRAQAASHLGQISSWSAFQSFLRREVLKGENQGRNVRLRLLTETVTSPTLAAQIRALLKKYPNARWHRYEAVGRDNVNNGARRAFGRAVNTVYDFSQAERVLSLDGDFLGTGPGSVRYARDFIDKRRVRTRAELPAQLSPEGPPGVPGASNMTAPGPAAQILQPPATRPAGGQGGGATQPGGAAQQRAPEAPMLSMNRLYMAESTPTITGAMADHRLGMQASQVEAFARAVLRELQGGGGEAATTQSAAGGDAWAAWVRPMVQDLRQFQGRSIVIAGEHQPPAVHVLAHLMNQLLGNVGKTVIHTEPVEAQPEADGVQSLRELVEAMGRNEFDVLVILGDNPAFTAPADFNFGGDAGVLQQFAAAPGHVVIHSSLYYNETSFLSHWHIPESHYLEQWGDVRAYDGTSSVVQPLIAPLYQSKSHLELLAALMGEPDQSVRDVVANHWRGVRGNDGFDQFWTDALRRGVIPDTAAKRLDGLTVQPGAEGQSQQAPTQPAGAGAGLEIIFRPDPNIWDGRFANNGWLQELPKPLTKLTWDSAALMSWATAVDLKIVNQGDDPRAGRGRVVRLRLTGSDGKVRQVDFPVWITPNHPDHSITVYLGYGREHLPHSGLQTDDPVKGFNAYPIRTSGQMNFARGLQVEVRDDRHRLAGTQDHQVVESRDFDARDIVRAFGLEDFKRQAEAPRSEPVHLSLYPEWPYGNHKWGMAVDMNACIGCNACVVACQSENNIPVVGREQVLTNREMHWIRIDTYYRGTDPGNAEGPYFQPMMCQHCEKAPCEVVCPVNATSHSAEGINEMTYNRCVGTRYCSNNCPYKVRRFNFLSWAEEAPAFQMMRNPDVTVRDRGVMEKCTYCIQRLNEARRELKKIDAQMRDVPQGAPDAQRAAAYKRQMDVVMGGLEVACQQACPTEAIVFGDLNWVFADGSRPEVVALKGQRHNYEVLDELITQPRTSYLPRLKNENPRMPRTRASVAGAAQGAATH